MKRFYLLTYVLSDKPPEQFLKFTQIILDALLGQLFTDIFMYIKSIATRIFNKLPGRPAQLNEVSALPAFGCRIILGDPENIIFSPFYSMFCQIHLPITFNIMLYFQFQWVDIYSSV
jgi:hypothetical protein